MIKDYSFLLKKSLLCAVIFFGSIVSANATMLRCYSTVCNLTPPDTIKSVEEWSAWCLNYSIPPAGYSFSFYYERTDQFNRAAYQCLVLKDGQIYDGIAAFLSVNPELSPINNGGNDSCDGRFDFANPINGGAGNKWQQEKDLLGNAFGLIFTRYYNARFFLNRANLGANWGHTYNKSIIALSSTATIYRPDGKVYYFKQSGNNWISDANVVDHLTEIKDSAGTRQGWRYINASNDDVETYNAVGRLLNISNRAGFTQTLSYDTNNRLFKVTDAVGHSLTFTFDGSNRIATMTDPKGGVYAYTYDTNNNLASVIYPDGKIRAYLYGEADNVPMSGESYIHALTGIIDENGNRFATYKYDSQGRAISSEHAGAVEKYSIAYTTDSLGNPVSSSVTDPLGAVRNISFSTILGVVKSKGQSQPGGSGCGASASALSYDANGNVASRTDFNGNRTNYAYDLTRNLETSRTEGLTSTGATTPATRTITTAWHPTFRLPVQITNGNQQTTYAYNSQGDITQKTVTDLSANTSRSWNTAYTYSAVPGVLLQKVEDGPRTDVSDLTTYDYYPADAACQGGQLGCRGQLKQITDALGHITQLTRYSAHGQLEQLTDPNGLVMTMAYDVRQRLTSFNAGGEITNYTYDPAGQVTRVTRPDGAYLAYTYDAAHRLIKTQDDQGNTLTYTLDAMGNRVKEEAHDPGGQLARTQSRVYDALSRLQNLVLPQ